MPALAPVGRPLKAFSGDGGVENAADVSDVQWWSAWRNPGWPRSSLSSSRKGSCLLNGARHTKVAATQ